MELNRLILIAALFTIVSMPMLSFSPLKCRKNAIDGYVNIAKNLVKKMALCAVRPLNDTIEIPLVDVVLETWKKMNETVQKTEILSHLRLLSCALAQVNVQGVPHCANETLKRLTKNVEDRILSFTMVPPACVSKVTEDSISYLVQSPDTSAPPILEDSERRNTSNILEIFQCYQKLMEGKIKMYLLNNCPTKSR